MVMFKIIKATRSFFNRCNVHIYIIFNSSAKLTKFIISSSCTESAVLHNGLSRKADSDAFTLSSFDCMRAG